METRWVNIAGFDTYVLVRERPAKCFTRYVASAGCPTGMCGIEFSQMGNSPEQALSLLENDIHGHIVYGHRVDNSKII